MAFVVIDLDGADLCLDRLGFTQARADLFVEDMRQDGRIGFGGVTRTQALYVRCLDTVVALGIQFFRNNLRLQGCAAVEFIPPHECVLAGAVESHIDVPAVSDPRGVVRIYGRHKFPVLFVGFHRGGIDRGVQFRIVPILPISRFQGVAAMLIPVGRELDIPCVVDNLVIGNKSRQTEVRIDNKGWSEKAAAAPYRPVGVCQIRQIEDG